MILAADIGSTNLKAAVFAPDGRRVSEAHVPLGYTVRSAERAELDPLELRTSFFDLIDRVLAMAGCSRGDLRRVSLTSQAQTFCLCDASGTPVTAMLGWTDARAFAEADELQKRLGRTFHRITGFPKVSPLSTLAKALWLKRYHPLPSDCHVVQISSWLAMALGAPHATDRNLAAMCGLYSIPDHDWWNEALEAIGFSAAQLGTAVDPGTSLATSALTRPDGFSEKLEVVLAANDHTAGAVGCGCRPGHPLLTLGTAGVLYRHAGNASGPFSPSGIWGPFPGGGYYELLLIDHACSALDWADDELFGKVDSQQLAERSLAGGVPEDAPFFHPARWGSDEAWKDRGTPEAMAYAAFEGIAFALREMAGTAFEEEKGTITILGGGSRLDLWVQLIADVLARPIARGKHDGLDGAAAIAGVQIATHDDAQTIFQPDNTRSRFLDARYRQWQSSFPSLNPNS